MFYNYAAYVFAMPFGWAFLLHLALAMVSAYSLIGLVAAIDGDDVQHRLRGAVPERLAGGVLAGLGLLFFFRVIGVLVYALTSGIELAKTDVAVNVADFVTTPAWVIGGILLWRRNALGYVAGLGLLFQGSMLFIATIAVLGGPMTEAKKNRIGYLPEERGLYQDLPLERCLLYLAALQDVPEREARPRLNEYLQRFDLAAHKQKKVKELSKGMQQKAQLIATLLHRPELVIADEPFTALDPINVQLVKDLLRELRGRGAAITMSTHQMHQVEELCDRIVLIDHGRDILYGSLDDIRRQYSGHAVSVRSAGEMPPLAGVRAATPENGGFRLALAEEATPQQVLVDLVSRGAVLEKFEIAIPSLEEIFIRVVEGGDAQ